MKPNEMHFIVFSMNRACQLDAFLSSMYMMLPENPEIKLSVLYKVSNNDYEQGYDIVKSTYPNINYHRETIIKEDIRVLSSDPDIRYIGFFCDDDVWKYPLSFTSEEFKEFDTNHQIISLSLRMSPLINKCYSMGGISTPPPNFEGPLHVWDWTDPTLSGDWSYPMSVDGGIFRKSLIDFYLDNIPFRNVTELEGHMAAASQRHIPKMICFKDAPLFNIPLNIASEVSTNINMNISKEYLNERFLKGDRIDTEFYAGFKNVSPHQEVPLRWK